MADLRTERLLLRGWRDEDLEPFAALNDDPRVMEHFPSRLSREASDAMVGRIAAHMEEHGWGLWAVEVVESGRFIGFVGLAVPNFTADWMPAVEIGWRLATEGWGHGYATEAAQVVLAHAFEVIGLDEVVSFTSTTNTPSQAVMKRIGMELHPASPFDHPNMERGHRLEEHVLYRITVDQWRERRLP